MLFFLLVLDGMIVLHKNGMVYENYSELRATEHLKQDNIFLEIDVGVGKSSSTVYTCDLTHKYIDINADYRS